MTIPKADPGVYRLILSRNARNHIMIRKGSKEKMFRTQRAFKGDLWVSYEMFVVDFRGEIIG